MRFRKSPSPPPYLNARHQRRLLMLAGLLALVLIAMRIAAKPETWSWLFAGQKHAAQTDGKSAAPGGSKNRPPKPLEPDEFRAHAVNANAANAGSPVALAAKSAAGDDVDLTIDPRNFANVEDGTYNVPHKELQGYYAILARVARVPQQALQDLAKRDGPVPYSVLRNEPASHRGRAITIDGKLGSLKVMQNSRPELGLKTLYEAWIVTPDSDNDPYRVVFSELPAGLEPQDLYSDPPPVRVTGYFFKVQTYSVRSGDDQTHRAPLLLAKRIQLTKTAEAASPTSELAPYVVGFALFLGAILAVFLWRFSIGDRKFSEQQLQRYDPARTANPADLKHLEAGEDPREFFRRLSESETTARPGTDAPADSSAAGR